MKITKEANTMTICLINRIDTINAEEVEKELFSAVENNAADITDIIIDADELKYISSAGLRILLRLKKKQTLPVSIVNVSRDVYDIFHATGLTKILNVHKKLRKVSLENCQSIGSGAHGKVYMLDDETIIKVYYDNSPLSVIDRERNNAKEAFVHGVPTAMAFETVITDEGYGVVFEKVGDTTIGSFILSNPEKLRDCSEKFAELLKNLNSIEADPALYPDTKSIYIENLHKAEEYFTQEENQMLIKLLNAVPDGNGMVHGDFSTNNIMVQPDGELIIIDMADITRGSKFFDIGSLFFTVWLNELYSDFDWLNEEKDKSGEDIAEKFRNITLESYFDTTDKEQLDVLHEICNAISLLRMAALLGTLPPGSIENAKPMVKILRKYLFPELDKFCDLLSKN